MQISGILTSPTVSLERITTPQAAQESTDKAELNVSADSFSSLVAQAGSMPEVRSEVVDAFKGRIQAGHYPTPEVISGLVDVIGGSVVHLATVSDS